MLGDWRALAPPEQRNPSDTQASSQERGLPRGWGCLGLAGPIPEPSSQKTHRRDVWKLHSDRLGVPGDNLDFPRICPAKACKECKVTCLQGDRVISIGSGSRHRVRRAAGGPGTSGVCFSHF